MITIEGFLSNLVGDAQRELQASAMYYAHASMFTGAYFYFVDTAKEHGDDEVKHFNAVCEQINLLGGISPAIQLPPPIVFGNEEMLQLELSGEREARTRYTERYEQALELRLYGVAKILADILADEDSHDNELSNVLELKSELPIPESELPTPEAPDA